MNSKITYRKRTGEFITVAFLSLLLAWLTVCLPYVYEARQILMERSGQMAESENNPFAGITEEKSHGNQTVNINEEYIHHNGYDFSLGSCSQNNGYFPELESTYIAFHAELHSPPPNILL